MTTPSTTCQTCAAAIVLVSWLWLSSPARAGAADDVRMLMERGEHAAALQRAQRDADANPRNVEARFRHGVVLMEIGRDAEALTLFGNLAQLYPELPDPMNNIALLHARAGRLDQALDALQTALRNDPAHRTAKANLAQVHLLLAVQSLEQLAASGAVDVSLLRKLEAARTLASMPTGEQAAASPR